MSERPDAAPDGLDALRALGATRDNPMRLAHLEALHRRAAAQSTSVQALLRARLHTQQDAWLADLRQRTSAPKEAATTPSTSARPSPLAQLNRELAARAWDKREPGSPLEPGASAAALPSVRRFGEVWARMAAERQVTEALMRTPDNAGPLNTHRLMLRALTLMQSLSPDYLHRFVGQMDALLWLDQVQQQITLKDGKKDKPAAKRARTRKA